MRAPIRRAAAALAIAAGGALPLGGCAGPQSAFAPAGPAAAHIATLWWAMLAAATVVCIVVVAATVYALLRRRGAAPPDAASPAARDERADERGTRAILLAGAVVPALILTALYVATLVVLRVTAPGAAPADLVVEVEGRQYWWAVRYPGRDGASPVVTANELHIPVGRRVEVRLRAADVIHSFWVPRLHGKTDLIPGRVNVTWLQADSAGVYRGQCAEFCGVQHARMAFTVVALPEARFAAWLAGQRAPAPAPASPAAREGLAVFLARCASCHAIRGTPARGRLGPDLTHLASRRTLAAGTLSNTRGHLAGWIANPQVIKRGALMPRVPLTPRELRALLAYLEGLR
ncbi:MAG TPA: cytochrome c oxidase subunit II [Gemmatimonadaceae bacterium]|nr:cytochrome c oxidase subunit II [Gemmatimonadaceae bacterium]